MSDVFIASGGVLLVVLAAADIFRSLLVQRASSIALCVGPVLIRMG